MTNTILDTREVLVIGANHRSSTMTARDRLFIEDADIPSVYEKLQSRRVFQSFILSTCDRIEIHAVQSPGDDTAARIIETFAEYSGMTMAELTNQLYIKSGEDAVRHIFRVAASLDSLIVGEPQILGQVKAAHRLSNTCGAIGAELETLIQASYESAKRIRTETGIGEGPVSIAASVVQLARNLHGDLAQCSILIIGAGDMGSLIASSLRETSVKHMTLTHPNINRIEAAAQDLDCHIAPFDQLAGQLIEADIVLTAMGQRQHVLSADMVESAIAQRWHKPVLLVDTSLPGDIEPAVSRIDDAFVYDLNDLEQFVVAGRTDRQAEAEKAAAIVEQCVENYLRQSAEQTAGPVLTLLRQHFEEARNQALQDAGQDAEKATRLLMNRLLHEPSEVLRKTAADDAASPPVSSKGLSDLETAMKKLFGLSIQDSNKKSHEKGDQ